MITFPIAKINLGLNITSRRTDGYHNLETVFFPVPITDALEVNTMHSMFPSATKCDIKVSNTPIEGDEQHNLVVKAFNLVERKYHIPRVHAHLFKRIPTQAGMGGGSSDGAFMIKMLNEMFSLKMSDGDMTEMAAELGADCPFFISAQPAYAEGIGEILTPIDLSLKGWHLTVVKPDIPIPTKEAFALIRPHAPKENCRDTVKRPVSEWKGRLVNDFEESVFARHPEIGAIKQQLYSMGATYAAMSGSGSSVFALSEQTLEARNAFGGMFCEEMEL